MAVRFVSLQNLQRLTPHLKRSLVNGKVNSRIFHWYVIKAFVLKFVFESMLVLKCDVFFSSFFMPYVSVWLFAPRKNDRKCMEPFIHSKAHISAKKKVFCHVTHFSTLFATTQSWLHFYRVWSILVNSINDNIPNRYTLLNISAKSRTYYILIMDIYISRKLLIISSFCVLHS